MEQLATDLDTRGVADALVANHHELVAAECRELVLAAAWADTHPAEAVHAPVMPGMERARRYGGDGTPRPGSSPPPSSPSCSGSPSPRRPG